MNKRFRAKIREKILKYTLTPDKILTTLDSQKEKLNSVQELANMKKGELWNCSICGAEVRAEHYPKHYFKCKMKLELMNRA